MSVELMVSSEMRVDLRREISALSVNKSQQKSNPQIQVGGFEAVFCSFLICSSSLCASTFNSY